MKKPFYSNRLDHIYKSLSSTKEIDLNKFKGNIDSIDRKYLKYKPKTITHYSIYNTEITNKSST